MKLHVSPEVISITDGIKLPVKVVLKNKMKEKLDFYRINKSKFEINNSIIKCNL